MTYIYSREESNCFFNWLQSSDNYKNSHSYEGAKAIFDYYESLAEDTGDAIEFDPVAWCCEFSEYESIDCDSFKADYPDTTLDDLNDNTQVISEEPLVFVSF
jgi:hypothetical protein